MQRELISAIQERIRDGHSEVAVIAEMVAVGYTAAEAKAAYATASAAAVTVSPEAGLPGIGTFLRETWHLYRTELPLLGKAVVLAIGTFVLAAMVIFMTAYTIGFSVQSSFFTTTMVGPLLAMLLGAIVSFALTRALLLRANGSHFREHVGYAFRNFFSLMLITFYVTIITQVGYLLFFIPGLVAAVYFLFALPRAFTKEARGLTALTESLALVYGRFLPVLGRFVVLNLVVVAAGLLCLFLVGSLFAGAAWYDPNLGLVGVPLFISAIISLVIMCVYWLSCGLVALYETLERVPSPLVPSPELLKNWRICFAVVIGLVLLMLAVLAFSVGFLGYTILSLW